MKIENLTIPVRVYQFDELADEIKVLFEKHDAHLAELKNLPCKAAADEARKKKDVA